MSLVISITGTNGKTTTLKILERLLLDNGYSVGLAGSLGIFVNGKKLQGKDSSGPLSYNKLSKIDLEQKLDFVLVENVLRHIKHGTFYPKKADIVLITNISKDHIHQTKTNSVNEIAEIKGKLTLSLHDSGVTILNKQDKYSEFIADKFSPPNLCFFDSNRNRTLTQKYPLTNNGKNEANINNISSVLKIVEILGVYFNISIKNVDSFLYDYTPGSLGLSGHTEIFKIKNYTIILDNAKNPAGYESIFKFATSIPHNKLISIPKASSTRTPEFIQELGSIAAKYSDLIFLKESLPKNSTSVKKGTVIKNLRDGALKYGFNRDNLIECIDRWDALRKAMAYAKENDLILFMSYKPKRIRKFLQENSNNDLS